MESILKENPISGKIIYMVFDDQEIIKKDKIVIYGLTDKDTKEEIKETNNSKENLVKNFEENLSFIAKSVFKYLLETDDDDTDNSWIFLSEIDKLKSTLEYQLRKEIGIEEYREYLDNLYFLEGELKRRIDEKEETNERGSR